jgi:hypothetical protein
VWAIRASTGALSTLAVPDGHVNNHLLILRALATAHRWCRVAYRGLCLTRGLVQCTGLGTGPKTGTFTRSRELPCRQQRHPRRTEGLPGRAQEPEPGRVKGGGLQLAPSLMPRPRSAELVFPALKTRARWPGCGAQVGEGITASTRLRFASLRRRATVTRLMLKCALGLWAATTSAVGASWMRQCGGGAWGLGPTRGNRQRLPEALGSRF